MEDPASGNEGIGSGNSQFSLKHFFVGTFGFCVVLAFMKTVAVGLGIKIGDREAVQIFFFAALIGLGCIREFEKHRPKNFGRKL